MKRAWKRVVLTALVVAVPACKGEQAGRERPGPRPVSVRAAPVERGTLSVLGEYTGELFADAVDLAPRMNGTLAAVPARLGDAVKRGQLVARLDDAEVTHQLEEARAALRAAEARGRQAAANLELARTELARKEPLAKDQLISAQELSELQARLSGFEAQLAAADAEAAQAKARASVLKRQFEDMRLVAPFDGTVAERRLEPGAAVGPSTPVVRLVAQGPVQVRFRVPERDLATVRPGQPIRVRTAATGAERHDGKVIRVGTEVSRTDRAVAVEGVLDEAAPLLLPGMYATVEVQERTLQDVLLVPSAAVLERNEADGTKIGVFVAVDGKAQWRPVQLLGRQGERTAVSGSLEAGDPVLTLGHEELSTGSLIRVVTPEGEAATTKEPASAVGGSR